MKYSSADINKVIKENRDNDSNAILTTYSKKIPKYYLPSKDESVFYQDNFPSIIFGKIWIYLQIILIISFCFNAKTFISLFDEAFMRYIIFGIIEINYIFKLISIFILAIGSALTSFYYYSRMKFYFKKYYYNSKEKENIFGDLSLYRNIILIIFLDIILKIIYILIKPTLNEPSFDGLEKFSSLFYILSSLILCFIVGYKHFWFNALSSPYSIVKIRGRFLIISYILFLGIFLSIYSEYFPEIPFSLSLIFVIIGSIGSILYKDEILQSPNQTKKDYNPNLSYLFIRISRGSYLISMILQITLLFGSIQTLNERAGVLMRGIGELIDFYLVISLIICSIILTYLIYKNFNRVVWYFTTEVIESFEKNKKIHEKAEFIYIIAIFYLSVSILIEQIFLYVDIPYTARIITLNVFLIFVLAYLFAFKDNLKIPSDFNSHSPLEDTLIYSSLSFLLLFLTNTNALLHLIEEISLIYLFAFNLLCLSISLFLLLNNIKLAKSSEKSVEQKIKAFSQYGDAIKPNKIYDQFVFILFFALFVSGGLYLIFFDNAIICGSILLFLSVLVVILFIDYIIKEKAKEETAK